VRSIKTLFNFEPPATDDENPFGRRAVRSEAERVSRPVESHEAAFERAVEQVATSAANSSGAW